MAKRGKINRGIIPDEYLERPVRSRIYKEFILIVCEDQVLEPVYFGFYQAIFDSIKPETVYLRSVGTGKNSLGVVEQAIVEREFLQEESKKHIDHTWVVFDKDDLDKSPGNVSRFLGAFELANNNNIKVAYSNECFELWLLLHYEDVNPEEPLSRYSNIYPRLENAINKGRTEASKIKYDHQHQDKRVAEIVFKSNLQKNAIERANCLNDYHESKGRSPIDSNPNTRVQKLVMYLNDMIEFYNRNE